MKKRKILIYIETPKDVLFAKQYIKSNNQQDEIVVVATSTPARIFAETLNLPYKSYSYITAEINKKNTLPQSYSIINKMINTESFSKEFLFFDYNLLAISSYNFLLYSVEVLNVQQLINKILLEENPNLILIPRASLSKRLSTITLSPYGLENYILYETAKEKKIPIKTYHYLIKNKCITNTYAFHCYNFIKYPNRYFKPLYIYIYKLLQKKQNSTQKQIFLEHQKLPHSKTLAFYICGGFYLLQCQDVLLELLKQPINILLIVLDDITQEESNVFSTYENCKIIKLNQIKTNKIKFYLPSYKKINKKLNKIIQEPLFNKILSKLIHIHFKFALPKLTNNLQVGEEIIKNYSPCFCYTHFISPSVSFPYIKYQIPTLGGLHGFATSYSHAILIFDTEYIPSYGKALTKYLKKLLPYRDKIIEIGDSRYKKIYATQFDKDEQKKQLNLPSKPICIFCNSDIQPNSLFSERHNHTYSLIKYAEKIARLYPDIFFIFRAHHGQDNSCFDAYIKHIALPNLSYSLSPDPLFTELVKCAELIIAPYSSSIVESLLSGIPVIYDYSHTYPCKDLLSVKNIYPINTFEQLEEKFLYILNNPKPPSQIKNDSNEFVDKVFGNGSSFSDAKELSQEILKISNQNSEDSLQTYEERISYFNSHIKIILDEILLSANNTK